MKLSSIAKNFFVRVINTEAFRTVAVLAICLIMTLPPLTAQDGPVRPSKTEAQAAWNRGDFDLAYDHYNGLLLLYSRDPLYKYFTGACLVKMERDLPRAVTLLGSAINNSANVKSVPDDVWFYYGRALHMTGSFVQASEAYDRFAREAGRKVAAEYGVQDFIDQCDKGQGAARGEASIKPEAQQAESLQKDANPSDRKVDDVRLETERAVPADPKVEVSKKETERAVPADPKVEVVKQETAGTVTQAPVISSDKVPGEYERVLGKAVRLQSSADSLARIAESASKALEEAPPGQKAMMENRAADARARAAAMQAEADSLFRSLEEEENPAPDMSAEIPVQPQPAHLFSRFELLNSPAYNEKKPVPIDISVPSGLIYTIQTAAFRNPVPPSLFRGLFPVYGRKRPESGTTYYYTGFFRRIDDAREALPAVRGAGFPDAFVIAMMDGTQVSMERAQVLAKEWADKPLPGSGSAITEQQPRRDETPVHVGTLSFRAEVMRIIKPVKPEVIDKIEMLAGTRGLDMIKNSSGETVFLIGNFITFESADEYVSLLIRNGYSSARVAAYVGIQEIPVEAAKELLNKLPDD